LDTGFRVSAFGGKIASVEGKEDNRGERRVVGII
jgi:hypothetical protein